MHLGAKVLLLSSGNAWQKDRDPCLPECFFSCLPPSREHWYQSDRSLPFQRRPTGLQNQDVLFVPQGVERTDLSPPSGLVGPAHLKTLVIDYPLLDKLAKAQAADETVRTAPAQGGEPTPAAEQGGATRRDLDSLEERLMQQDRDIQALKEELRRLQGEGGARE